MADPFSIAASCVGLIAAIATATVRINGFVRTARDARADLDTVSRELVSLRTVLELIQADAELSQDQLPPTIVHHLCEVLSNCNGAVADIETVLKRYEKKDAMTSGQWAMSGKGDVEKLKAHLEAHTSALGLVLDMTNLVISIKVRHNTSAIQAQTTDIKLDTANILLKIEQLQACLPNMREERDDYMLQRYLEEMTTYTEEMLSGVDHNSEPDVVVANTETPKTLTHSTYPLGTDAEMAALEEFLETDVKPTPSTSTSSPTARPSTTEQSTIRPPPKRVEDMLFHGNLVIDIGLPQEVLDKFPHGERDEFTHVRYTAVTCDPQAFETRGYSLRASLFSKPRSTDILLSVFFNTGPDPATLPGVLCKAWDAVDQLCRKTTNGLPPFDDSGWKRVILHLHFATPPKGLAQTYLNDISALPTRYADSGSRSSDGASSWSDIAVVKGELVLWHMYEVYLLRPANGLFDYALRTVTEPLLLMSDPKTTYASSERTGVQDSESLDLPPGYEVDLPEIKSATECNCNICAKKAYLWLYASREAFRVVKGNGNALTPYTFGAELAVHKFCSNCGTPLLCVVTSAPPVPHGLAISV
ncbi:hypothetical protein OQA88_10255 [Cercophora sp. LCS_1]